MRNDPAGPSRTSAVSEHPYGVAPAGYRLPDETRLGRVVLQTSDLERSIGYYTRVLGFDVHERSSAVATLGPRGTSEVIVELRERPGVHPVPRRGRLGLYHFAILLPDRASLGRFVAHLSRIGAYAGMSDHLVSEAVYLTDPDGLGIEVYADRPRSSWTHEGRQLVMTTKPLDVPDLLREAGDSEWSGAPEGTRLGHVHLYVDQLDRAAAFYHDALGFDKVVWNYPGALFLSAGGYHHHLGTNTWAAESPLATDNDARLVEWEIVLPDEEHVKAAAASVAQAGFGIEHDGNDALVRDPWGTRIRLVTSA